MGASSVALSLASLGILKAFDFYPSKKLVWISLVFFMVLLISIFFGAAQYDEGNLSNSFVFMAIIYTIGMIVMGIYLNIKHFSYESSKRFVIAYGVILIADAMLMMVLMNILAAFTIVLFG
jgi:membrane protein YdbS with pleckstrin-like domain